MTSAFTSSPAHHLQRLASTMWRSGSHVVCSESGRRNILALMDQAVVSAASFGTAILLGRFGSREELGVYALALTILMLMGNVQGELITAPYLLFRHRRHRDDVPRYTGSMLLHELAVACLAFVAFGVIALLSWSGFAPPQLLAPMSVLALAGPFWLARVFIRYLSFAHLQFGTALLVDMTTAVLQFALLLYLLFTQRLTAASTFAVMGAACAIAAGGWWLARRVPIQFSPRSALQDFVSNWSFSRWALASQLIGCSTPYLMPWLLAEARGAADTGTFAACTNLCGIATMFVSGLAHALTPQAAQAFATGGKAALVRILTKTTMLFVGGVGSFCLVSLVAGELAITAIYGPSFANTHWTFVLLTFAVFTNSLAIISGNGLWAVNRPQCNLIADITVLLVTVTTACVFIQPLGIIGAALATLLGSTAGAAIRAFVFQRVLRGLDDTPLRT